MSHLRSKTSLFGTIVVCAFAFSACGRSTGMQLFSEQTGNGQQAPQTDPAQTDPAQTDPAQVNPAQVNPAQTANPSQNVNQSQNQSRDYEAELLEKDARLYAMEASIYLLQTELDAKSVELVGKVEELGRLTERIDALTKQADITQKDIESLRQELAQAQEKAAELQKEIGTLKTDMADKESKIATLEKDKEALRMSSAIQLLPTEVKELGQFQGVWTRDRKRDNNDYFSNFKEYVVVNGDHYFYFRTSDALSKVFQQSVKVRNYVEFGKIQLEKNEKGLASRLVFKPEMDTCRSKEGASLGRQISPVLGLVLEGDKIHPLVAVDPLLANRRVDDSNGTFKALKKNQSLDLRAKIANESLGCWTQEERAGEDGNFYTVGSFKDSGALRPIEVDTPNTGVTAPVATR